MIHTQIGTSRAHQSCIDNINPFVIEEMVRKDFVGPPLVNVFITFDYLYIHTMQLVGGIFGTQPQCIEFGFCGSIASTTTSPSAAGAGLGTGKAQRDGGDIFITSDYLYIHM